MRLDKFLANENIGSRKAVGVLVRSGAVTVNGQAVKKADMQVDPACDTVCVNGAPLRYNAHTYIMMNKPAGVLTATRDSRAETVLDLLPPALKRRGLFPAGRLDKDTTGLLILTDDGDYAHRMLAPKSHVMKRYEAALDLPAEAADKTRFAAGIRSGEDCFAPARTRTRSGSRSARENSTRSSGCSARAERPSRRSGGFPSARCVLTPRWVPVKRAFCRKKRLCLSLKRN